MSTLLAMNSLQDSLSGLRSFKQRLNGLGILSEHTWTSFSERLEYVQYPKSAAITTAGSTEQWIYFILKGAVRVFVISEGREVVTNFRFDNQFTSSLTSFLTQSPSQYFLHTMAETTALRFHYTSLQEMYKNHIDLNVLGRVLMEQLLIDKRQRELDFLTLSADKRYQKLLEEHPEYVQNIPLKYIASFLGVTPESLSRIRKSQLTKV